MIELRSPSLSSQLEEMLMPLTKQRIGVDAVHLPSWARYLEVGGPPFLRRVYTDAELVYSDGDRDRLASRFAAKEAVLKVLGTGISGIGLSAVEIITEGTGRPRVRLRGRASGLADALSMTDFEVSLCHE